MRRHRDAIWLCPKPRSTDFSAAFALFLEVSKLLSGCSRPRDRPHSSRKSVMVSQMSGRHSPTLSQGVPAVGRAVSFFLYRQSRRVVLSSSTL